ncbi:hypothetical protein AURDEDRAFT_186343 [Auricularia subglabra TFB-10046 SS5]|nr:hypothetical protein AURDEDRAFT_186343 [Auricularia subglabra TFB-10046 SS5]
MSHLAQAGREASQRVFDTARAEISARKARKKLIKTKCGRCGQGATGTKLQTCSRCKSINYCSAACQREHWKAGHKADCNGFAHPPFAKHFDASDRQDVPWPEDPIFASQSMDGIGLWMTTHGSLSSLLQQAFEPIDLNATSTTSPQGPPSYQRWAGIAGPRSPAYGPALMKYIGSTMLGLRVIVQNRRQDGRVMAVFPGEMELVIHARIKDNLLPDDLKKAKFMTTSGDHTPVMSIPPWTDYNGVLRTGIIEFNGAEAPKGKFKGTMERPEEYEPAAKPSGEPWDRVIDWSAGSVMLAPGDYVVFACQYRVGDGSTWKAYPELLDQTLCITIPVCRTQNTVSDASWCDAVRRDVVSLKGRRPAGICFMMTARMDHAYFDEYYKPYFDEDSDAFAASRLGRRAEEANEMVKSFAPMAMSMLMQSMPPRERAEAVRRFNAMGFDIEAAFRQSGL